MSSGLLNLGLDNMVSTDEIVALSDRDQIGLHGAVAAADADASRALQGGRVMAAKQEQATRDTIYIGCGWDDIRLLASMG